MAKIDTTKGKKVLDVKNIDASISLLDKAVDVKLLKKLGDDMKKFADITKQTDSIKKNLGKFRDAIKDLGDIDDTSAETLSNLSNAIGGLSDPEEIKQFRKGVKELDKISGDIAGLSQVQNLESIATLAQSLDSLTDLKKVKGFKKGLSELSTVAGKISIIAKAAMGGGRTIKTTDPATGKPVSKKVSGDIGALAQAVDSISDPKRIKRFKKGVKALTGAYGSLQILSTAAGESIGQLSEGMRVMGDMKRIAKFKLGVVALTFLIHDISELETVGTDSVAALASAMTNISKPTLILKFAAGLKLLRVLIAQDLVELGDIAVEGLADLSESMTNISNPIMVGKFALGLKIISNLILGDVVAINEANKDGGLTQLSESMAAIANIKRILLFSWGIRKIAKDIEFLERIGDAGAGAELKDLATSMGAISDPWMVLKFKLGIKLIVRQTEELKAINDSLKGGEGLATISRLIKNYSSLTTLLKFKYGIKIISKLQPEIEKLNLIDTKGIEKLESITDPSTVGGLKRLNKVIRSMTGMGKLDSPKKAMQRIVDFNKQMKLLDKTRPTLVSFTNEVDIKALIKLPKMVYKVAGLSPLSIDMFVKNISKLSSGKMLAKMKVLGNIGGGGSGLIGKVLFGEKSGLMMLIKVIKKFTGFTGGQLRMQMFITSINRLHKIRDKLSDLSAQGVDIYRLAGGPMGRVASMFGRGGLKVAGMLGRGVLATGSALGRGGLATAGMAGRGGLALAPMLGRGALATGEAAGRFGIGAGGMLGGLGVKTGGILGKLGISAGGVGGRLVGATNRTGLLDKVSKVTGLEEERSALSMLGLGKKKKKDKKKAGSVADIAADLERSKEKSFDRDLKRRLVRIERSVDQIKRKLGIVAGGAGGGGAAKWGAAALAGGGVVGIGGAAMAAGLGGAGGEGGDGEGGLGEGDGSMMGYIAGGASSLLGGGLLKKAFNKVTGRDKKIAAKKEAKLQKKAAKAQQKALKKTAKIQAKAAKPGLFKRMWGGASKLAKKLNPMEGIKKYGSKMMVPLKKFMKGPGKAILKKLPFGIGALITAIELGGAAMTANELLQSGKSPREVALEIMPQVGGAFGALAGTALGLLLAPVAGPFGSIIMSLGGNWLGEKLFENFAPEIVDMMGNIPGMESLGMSPQEYQAHAITQAQAEMGGGDLFGADSQLLSKAASVSVGGREIGNVKAKQYLQQYQQQNNVSDEDMKNLTANQIQQIVLQGQENSRADEVQRGYDQKGGVGSDNKKALEILNKKLDTVIAMNQNVGSNRIQVFESTNPKSIPAMRGL